MKKTAMLIMFFGMIILVCLLLRKKAPENREEKTNMDHVYASWDVKEYDQCVAIWLIKRFYDTQAQFVFYPTGTEITKGIVFDVPGAVWSRQHRKCTSDCILEELKTKDSAIESVVKMAHDVELNFWQLDSFPDSRQSFQEVMQILDNEKDKNQFLEEIISYFDQRYSALKNKEQQ